MSPPAGPPLRRSTPRFLLTFAAVAALGFGLLLSTWGQEHVVTPLAEALAGITAQVVQGVGGSAHVSGATIRHEGGFAVTVAARCIGLEALVLLWAGMAAFPARGRERCIGFAAGAVVMMAFNLVRIISLYGIGPHSATLFEWVHLYSGDLFAMIPGLIVFVLWIRWLPSQRRVHPLHAALA
jgi:exosortase H (IPTLxxWG-CTERM-specific)